MKKLILPTMLLSSLSIGCSIPAPELSKKPFVITNKFPESKFPGLSKFYYEYNGMPNATPSFIDSSHFYKVGDSIK